MAQYTTAFNVVQDIHQALEQYRGNIIKKKIKKKSIIKSVASELQIDIAASYAHTNFPELAKLRKHLKVLQTNLSSIEELMQSDVTYNETLNLFKGKFSDRIDELDLLLQKAKVDVEDDELRNQRHAKSTKSSFTRMKSKYAPKLRTRLRPGSVKFVEVPVMAQLNPQINKPKLLNELGIEHETFGLEHNTRDLGVVFKDQYLLMFNKEEAVQAAKEAQTESTKQSSAHMTREKRNTTKKLREVLGKFAQVCGYDRRDEIKDFVAEAMKLKSDELEPMLSRMFTRSISDRELRKVLKGEVDSITQTIMDLVKRVAEINESMKPTKAAGRKRQRDIERTNSPLINTVHQVLRDMEQKNSIKLSLLTDVYVNNPENSKLVMFWIVPTKMYRNLSAFASGDKMVTRWGLPWSSKG